MHKGSCLCGAVTFDAARAAAAPVLCHCKQCRQQSGHAWAGMRVPRTALAIAGEAHLAWFRSSGRVKRGFCSTCGSSLFWDPVDEDWISVAMGALQEPTRTRLAGHIFVADKGDYYDICDGLPQTRE